MRHRAVNLVHVLARAPVAALVAAALTPVWHAQAAAPPEAPPPVVVCIDPGHGGAPDNAHPERAYDPGAVAATGLIEKEVVLDLARRLRRLLEADLVSVVLTRDADVDVDIATRSQTANRAGAAVFVSIHLNGFLDPKVGGTVILYPRDTSLGFARTMSDALAKRLGPLGIDDDGTMLRDNWWLQTTMPTVTVEAAYLSNPREADLLRQDRVRDAIAAGIRDGIEAQVPEIQRRKAAVLAARAADSGDGAASAAAGAAAASQAASNAAKPLTAAVRPPATGVTPNRSALSDIPIGWALLSGLVAFVVTGRRRLTRAVVQGLRRLAGERPPAHRHSQRTARRRQLIERGATRRALRPSVYDELRL
jgi:N-acetylmuramoyl-L-alanine amidase